MKTLTLLSLLLIGTSLYVKSQDACVSLIASDLNQLETDVSSLKGDKNSLMEIQLKIEDFTNELAACADNTEEDLSSYKNRLAVLKTTFEGKKAGIQASQPRDVNSLLSQFYFVRSKLFRFPSGEYREDFDPQIMNRENIEFFLTYFDHPYTFEDEYEQNSYEGSVKTIIDIYKESLTLFNSEEWAEGFEHQLKRAKETNDLNFRKKKLEDMEKDLVLWQELLFPNSKKMKEYLARVRAAK